MVSYSCLAALVRRTGTCATAVLHWYEYIFLLTNYYMVFPIECTNSDCAAGLRTVIHLESKIESEKTIQTSLRKIRRAGWLITRAPQTLHIPASRSRRELVARVALTYRPPLDCKFLQSGHYSTFRLYLTNFVRSWIN